VDHEQPDEVDNKQDKRNLPEKRPRNCGTNGERHRDDWRKMSVRDIENLGKSFVQCFRSLEKCT